MDSNTDFGERLYLLNIIGKSFTDILEDINQISDIFFDRFDIETITYGNSIYFSSNKTLKEITDEIESVTKIDFAYALIDITDNLNYYDFKAHITKEHKASEKFATLIRHFVERQEHFEDEVVEEILVEKTREQQLQDALESENYEEAARIRDEMKLEGAA